MSTVSGLLSEARSHINSSADPITDRFSVAPASALASQLIWTQVATAYACERCPYKQQFLLQTGACGDDGCLFDDATTLGDDEQRKCIRHDACCVSVLILLLFCLRECHQTSDSDCVIYVA